MAHLQLTAAVAGGGGRDDEMEEVALLGSYDVRAGPGEEEEEAGMRRVQVRVAGMTCSACTGAVEAAVSARRGVRHAAVSLLQNRACVVFDPALVKVMWRDCDVILACFAPAVAWFVRLWIVWSSSMH